ncbi:MAG: hypothetical protein ACR2N3_13935 [Pyrinomonadaceae bacterium]
MKFSIFLIIVFYFFAFSASKNFACTCELPLKNLSVKSQIFKAYKQSVAVFYGEATEINKNPKNFYVSVKFKVEKSWKNHSFQELIIQTGLGNGDCGYIFEIGKKYLVYAYGDENDLQTNICQRTSLSVSDYKYLDRIKKPKSFPK